ncbi:MAG: ABC transporter ATP-binding protein [Bdellovibrionota bacterium]
MSATPLLTVAAVSYWFGDNKALNEFSFELDTGEWLAVFGPNGSGKSTLLKLIAGVISVSRYGTNGEVLLRGGSVFKMDQATRAAQIAYVSADLRAEFPLTAWEAVALGRICHSTEMLRKLRKDEAELVQKVMKECFCWELREREISTLSGGERQLVLLARALAQGSRILLLDETFSKMDLNHQSAMGAVLKKQVKEGKSIVMVSHDLNLASEWADTCVFISKGMRIAHGKMATVLTEANLKKIYPQTPLAIGKNPVTGAPKVFFSGLTTQ